MLEIMVFGMILFQSLYIEMQFNANHAVYEFSKSQSYGGDSFFFFFFLKKKTL